MKGNRRTFSCPSMPGCTRGQRRYVTRGYTFKTSETPKLLLTSDEFQYNTRRNCTRVAFFHEVSRESTEFDSGTRFTYSNSWSCEVSGTVEANVLCTLGKVRAIDEEAAVIKAGATKKIDKYKAGTNDEIGRIERRAKTRTTKIFRRVHNQANVPKLTWADSG